MTFPFLILALFSACEIAQKVHQASHPMSTKLDFSIGPPTMVYKTKKDFSQQVFVFLSADKTKVVAYPAPSDAADITPLPSKLVSGYLLDNRGIGPNVAFLKMTWAEYSKLTEPPSRAELFNQISEKEPLLELCDCGNRHQFKKPVEELNSLIGAGKLTLCKKLK